MFFRMVAAIAKVASFCKADLELFERDLTLEIKGTDKQRRAARKSRGGKTMLAPLTRPVATGCSPGREHWSIV